jgi:amidohydrolase
MRGTVRWFDKEVGDLLAQRIPELIQGIASALRGSAEIEYRRGGQATVNDPAVAALVREALADVVGAENVQDGPRMMASEDFAEFTQRVPSTFFFVGCRDERTGKDFEHHHPRFDIDEAALPLGVEMLTRSALRWLDANAN